MLYSYCYTLLLLIEAMTTLHITGYGKTKQNIFNKNTKLNHGFVKIWNMTSCKDALTLFEPRLITDNNYCAGQWKSQDTWTGGCTDKVRIMSSNIKSYLTSWAILMFIYN